MRLANSFPAPARSVLACALLLFITLGAACGRPPSTPSPPGPPTIVCPASIERGGVLGGSEPVLFPTPSVSGGALPVVPVCTPASGSPFPLGSTTVSCTVTDALSRQATCTFTITLRAPLLAIRRIVAFGDSVTAGEDGRRLHLRIGFVDPLRAYPAVLQGLFARDFPGQDVTVVNEGRGGVRAKDDEDRLERVLAAQRPDVLVVLHGYNDLLNDGLRAVDEVVAALRAFVRLARAAGVQYVFVSTLTPSRPSTGRFNRTIDPRAIQETNSRLAAMVPAEGARLVDAYAAFAGREAQLVEEDGLHLTAAGNEVLAMTLYEAMRAAGIGR